MTRRMFRFTSLLSLALPLCSAGCVRTLWPAVRGRVVDADTAQPIADARIEVEELDGSGAGVPRNSSRMTVA
jgi:hypothetical protein